MRFLSIMKVGAVLTLNLATTMALAATSYVPMVGTGSTGYKTYYDPAGSNVLKDGSEYSLATQAGNYGNSQWRLFVPPGSKRLYVSLSLYLVAQDTRAAVRFKQTPVSAYADITESTRTTDVENTLKNLIAGQELRFYSPPSSGGLTISQPLSTDTFQSTEGGWIYFNMPSIPGGVILNVQTRVVVNGTCYESWYANASWDTSNNPSEDATHSCSGSSGGTTTPPPTLTGLSLSRAILNFGSSETSTISPLPSGASLGTCSANSALVTVSGSTISLNNTATPPTQDTLVTITCSSQSTTLTVKPATQSTTATAVYLRSNAIYLKPGETATLITEPSGATLPSCTLGENAGTMLSLSGSTLTASNSAPSQETEIQVSCGTNLTAKVVLLPMPSTTSMQATVNANVSPVILQIPEVMLNGSTLLRNVRMQLKPDQPGITFEYLSSE